MSGSVTTDERLGLRPLTARSVLLSVLLGTHPPELPVRALVRAGALFGIPDGTIRVALSRMAADGDVEAGGGRYRLAGRLLERQRRQDEGRAAAILDWDGSWELILAGPRLRGADAKANASALTGPLRMAEWRDGVWGRPANLGRRLPDVAQAGARIARTGPLDDPAGLAGQLWDLDAWAARALELTAAMDDRPGPALHFTISAAVVAHLRDDPLLPFELLPRQWPGATLRRRYTTFEADLTALLRREL
ncbi:hypothetical protein K6U06_07730 [Acidiferrimicrobium sp. IK]|uniref:hypothetical protein n=1 Tax=Acidiferrimicrobium sp. IK TaxID=2871700 RepID=UPI0021CAF5DC|nr:hypothetical protein [Acidiferrimicrobium sp. IK]MCU4184247.1 hypothetical protein [Acidiferrimicrobium sp. IK]